MGLKVRASIGFILAGFLAATLSGCDQDSTTGLTESSPMNLANSRVPAENDLRTAGPATTSGTTTTSATAPATAAASAPAPAATATPVTAASPVAIPTAAPTISGSPATAAVVGTAYRFTPSASGAAGSTLKFMVTNAPAWATFDPVEGTLSGTPTASSVGTTAKIVIGVTNGVQIAALPGFSIAVSEPKASEALTISGSPPATASVGAAYSFRPTSADTAAATLSYTITNKPVWATFDSATGALAGTPGVSNVGVNAQIGISVSDGTVSATLTAFSITVASAPAESVSLAWSAPTENADGSPITNLAGYRVYYGTSAQNLNEIVDVQGAGDLKQVVANLASGTWYFAVTSVNSEKVESSLSAVVPVSI